MDLQSDFVQIEGVEEVVAALNAWRVQKVPRIVRTGMRTGAKLMRAAMKAETNFAGQSRTNPGGLLKGIKYASVRGTFAFDIGPMGKGTAHRHLVIRGHDVKRAKNGPVLGHAGPNPFVFRGEQDTEAMAKEAIAAAFAASTAEVWT